MNSLAKHLVVVVCFMIVAAVAAYFLTLSSVPLFRKPLPQYGALTSFTLTDSNGLKFTNKDLTGKVWIADFIYTTCPSQCITLTSHMRKLEKDLPADVKMVSISVDPELDSPAALQSYRRKYDIASPRWFFLTGPKAKVYDLIENGFHVGASPNPNLKEDPENKFVHTTQVALVDKKGVIRGYYNGMTGAGIEELQRDLHSLLQE